ncbi:helix-turn-helix domain-containing protein [Nocardiopsis chromatogenes]|uniref:helix-turn-helix domain-containing protein n=1 Tax=Nocardiopsis chromatogenes TaxID=280239 RepID=UPI00034AA9A4|nr:helix-turn-helix transcriptional regulator [Nocardiopsis chromatogenes]
MAGSPTVRRKRLSRRLKELREARGMTSEEATKKAGFSRGKLTRMERDEWTRPNPKDIATLLDVYKVADEGEREAYLALAKQARQRGWWVSYSDALGKGAYVGLETEASSIRTVEALLIPGLLQTEDYARAVVRASGVTDTDEIDRRVEARMLRKQVLARPDAPTFWAIVDEAALRKVTPDLADQLQHLLDVQRTNLRIQVLPDSMGPHAAMAGNFVVLDFPEDPSVVYLESAEDQLFLEDPVELRQYELLYGYVQSAALSVDDSRAFIQERLNAIT